MAKYRDESGSESESEENDDCSGSDYSGSAGAGSLDENTGGAPSRAAAGGGDPLAEAQRSLRKRDAEVAELQKEVKRLKGELKRQSGDEFLAQPKHRSAEETEKQGQKIRDAIRRTLSAQMVYKPAMKRGGKAQVRHEVPNVDEALVKVIMGAAWPGAGTGKAKTIKASDADLDISGKGLRFGACLCITDLVMTYHRDDKSLEISGKYSMVK